MTDKTIWDENFQHQKASFKAHKILWTRIGTDLIFIEVHQWQLPTYNFIMVGLCLQTFQIFEWRDSYHAWILNFMAMDFQHQFWQCMLNNDEFMNHQPVKWQTLWNFQLIRVYNSSSPHVSFIFCLCVHLEMETCPFLDMILVVSSNWKLRWEFLHLDIPKFIIVSN